MVGTTGQKVDAARSPRRPPRSSEPVADPGTGAGGTFSGLEVRERGAERLARSRSSAPAAKGETPRSGVESRGGRFSWGQLWGQQLDRRPKESGQINSLRLKLDSPRLHDFLAAALSRPRCHRLGMFVMIRAMRMFVDRCVVAADWNGKSDIDG